MIDKKGEFKTYVEPSEIILLDRGCLLSNVSQNNFYLVSCISIIQSKPHCFFDLTPF